MADNYKLQHLATACTSKGCLSKGWYSTNDNKLVLVKGNIFDTSRNIICYEPYSEVLASVVAKHLGIPHLEYALASKELFPEVQCSLPHVSVCYEQKTPVGYTRYSAYKLLLLLSHKKNIYDYWSYYLRLPIDFKSTWDMLVFDAIVGNVDRHLNNWDYFVRVLPNGLDIQLCPIFDNGDCLLASMPASRLNTNMKLGCDLSKPFKSTHTRQLALIKHYFPDYRPQLNPDILWQAIELEIQSTLGYLPDKRAFCVSRYLHNRLYYYSKLIGGD